MKVSVITTAYNHHRTLKRAIDSVQMQKGVEIEHIVIDDTLTHKGMMRTYADAFKRCTGEYIAFCDGDDYWIDEHKLLRQICFMNIHSLGVCLTKVYTEINGNYNEVPVTTDYINKNMSFDSLLKGTAYIYAQSYLIRKSDFDKYIDFEKFIRLGFHVWDYPIVLKLIKHTKFYCSDFYSAVYVKNEESVTNTRGRAKRFKYVMGTYWIRLYFICKYGCKLSTIVYLAYRFFRHLYSITFKTWT
jgi:glycosyltransferase involved in cell wall biosynthesis